jgi:hypothetical protein
MSYVIGITGRAGAGKDTFAAAFAEEARKFGKTVTCMALADPLKEVCEVLFGNGDPSVWRTQEGKAGQLSGWSDLGSAYATRRSILQTIGTDVFRKHVTPNFWLRVAASRISRIKTDIVVITDVRFDDEAMFVRSAYGGTVVKVVNRNQKKHRRSWLDVLRGRNKVHRSERGVSKGLVDFVFESDSACMTESYGRLFVNHV